MKIFKYIVIVYTLLVFVSCSNNSNKLTIGDDDINGNWVLSKLNDQPLNRSIKLPILDISLSDKRISGEGGCNNYSGAISNFASSSIQFEKIVSTRMACLNNNIEQDYFDALSETYSYTLNDNEFSLLDEKDNIILSFQRAVVSKPRVQLHDIWIAIRIGGNPINRMTPIPRLEINLTENKVYGSDGCNEFSGTLDLVTANQIAIGNIASTKKMCPDIEAADQYNRQLDLVTSYRLEGLNLILEDRNGHEVLAFLKGD